MLYFCEFRESSSNVLNSFINLLKKTPKEIMLLLTSIALTLRHLTYKAIKNPKEEFPKFLGKH